MIRGGTRSGRIALVGVCVLGALAVAAPSAVVAQPAVDEYSLDIPSGGSGSPGSSDGTGAPSVGATASGSPTSSGGGESGAESGGGRADTGGQDGKQTGASRGEEVQLDEVHDGGGSGELGTSSRSAPEVVADSLLDGAMWPLLAALLVITGIGAWRVLRGRGILSRHAG